MLVKRYLDFAGYCPRNFDEIGDWVLLERDPLTKRDLRGLGDPVQIFMDVPYSDVLLEVVRRRDYSDNALEYSLERNVLVEDLVWDRDADDVMDLEEQVFLDPWNPAGFMTELDSPLVYGTVVRYRNSFAGYSINRMSKPRLQFKNIAVAPELQGERVGMRLVDEAFDRAGKNGVTTLLATVCSESPDSVGFFKGLWFYHAKTQKDENFPDKWVFEFKLPGAYDYLALPRSRGNVLEV